MPTQKITKKDLLRACIQVFRKQGYYRTSIQDLAQATGLTKGVFYHHFASKEEIMHTVLDETSTYFAEKVFKAAYDTALSAEQRLENVVAAALKAFSNELGGCIFANTVLETAHVEDTFLNQIKAFFASWQQAMQTIFAARHDVATADKLAARVIADVEGSLVLMQLYKDRHYLTDAFARAKELL
ncbi:TetR/AcrR family transcriptional regulator [Hymenobacter terrenus]|uniref:TetR/AcrR family transcriptional regulator n=1 Tax=Hymenobacter terrenus TaxID=1629124 RepID=UPI00061940C9|nr:TetR/AcrR family transcriptional regulator [Hymenobacter terrenus]